MLFDNSLLPGSELLKPPHKSTLLCVRNGRFLAPLLLLQRRDHACDRMAYDRMYITTSWSSGNYIYRNIFATESLCCNKTLHSTIRTCVVGMVMHFLQHVVAALQGSKASGSQLFQMNLQKYRGHTCTTQPIRSNDCFIPKINHVAVLATQQNKRFNSLRSFSITDSCNSQHQLQCNTDLYFHL